MKLRYYANIGKFFKDTKQLDSALYYAQRGYETSLKPPSKNYDIWFKQMKSILLDDLGEINFMLGNREIALGYFNDNIRFRKKEKL